MTTRNEAFEMGREDYLCGEIAFDENPFEGFAGEEANVQAWEEGFLQAQAECEAYQEEQESDPEAYAAMWHEENNYDY